MNVYVYKVTRKGQSYELKVPSRSRVKADEQVADMKGKKVMQIEFVRMDNGMDQTTPRVRVDKRAYIKVHGNNFEGLRHWWFEIPTVGLWTPQEVSKFEEALQRARVRCHIAGGAVVRVVPFHKTPEADLEQMGGHHV